MILVTLLSNIATDHDPRGEQNYDSDALKKVRLKCRNSHICLLTLFKTMELDTNTIEAEALFIIKATNVPRDFFENRDVAKRYFRRFGKVKLVMFKPKKNALLIEYTNEDSMLNALELAGEYNGHLFNVSRDTETIIPPKKKKKDPDPDWTDDPEVKAELEAMGAFEAPRNYDLRSDGSGDVKMKQRRWKGSPKPPKKMSMDQAEFSYIVKQQALTIDDKFKILDARDKLIRIKMKNVELFQAKATVGTCPDMCPEKERLMREIQHQVALYEQEESGRGMNPKLAVKQYSRSSADQEAPLPQELRPVGVLQMTMGYLMHRIMGLCESPEVNIAEWYHFLWDRTRGIRKDITQQELCCQGSVELVEQCARFHIFCSARLVSEDPSVFDQKINTENLTKCLQTLKYMYHDLQLKGESCGKEAEFRAYIILLNLNDGNFMWEVQQLKKDIQQSKEVKFALEVYSSLDKQNYVKFFKLVNSTTFLNACILMRYFIQVRITAIKTLLKSYSPRVSQTSLPIHYLTKILGFEGPESAIDFFESYGLFTDVERSRIVLDRPGFSPPDYPYILDRAINLVESKRQHSVGEVICGKKLPPKLYENHTPQDSFDKEGYLKTTPDLDEMDSSKPEPMKIEEMPEILEEKIDDPRPFTAPIQFTPSQSIFAPPTSTEPTPSIFTPRPPDPIFTPRPPDPIFAPRPPDPVFGQNIFSSVIPTPDVDDQKKLEEERKKLAEEKLRKRKEEEEAERRRKQKEEERRWEEQHRKFLQEEEKRRRTEEAMRRKLFEEQQKKKEQERRKNIEIKVAVSNVISELLDAVDGNMKREKLAEISSKIYNRRVRRVIEKWRENTRRRRKRKALDFDPVWFGMGSLQEQTQEWRMGGQNLALQSMKRYKRGKALDVQPPEEEELSKIDLCVLTYKLLCKKFLDLDSKLHNELFWKVTISLPNEFEYGCGLNHVQNILDGYIKWERRGGTTVRVEQSKTRPTITYCLEKQQGLVVNKRNDTNGFIFIGNDFSDDLCQRIRHNLKNFGACVKTPVVVVLQKYTQHKSDLQTLISEHISDCLILVDNFTSKNLINLIEEALIFLSTRVEKSPPLELDTLKSFLLNNLSIIWKRANSFSKWNSNYKDCLKNPNTVIYLHNEALDRLKAALLNDTTRQHEKFPHIFKEFLRSQIPESLPCDYKYFPEFWDKPSYLKHLETIVEGLKLPNYLEDWPPPSPRQLEKGVSEYCSRISDEPEKCFYKTMSILLKGMELGGVLWTDIIELWTTIKVSETDFSLYGTGFVNKSIYNQLIAVYDIRKLNECVRSDWFYVNHPIIKLKIEELLKEEIVVAPPSQIVDRKELDLDAILNKIRRPQNIDVGKIKTDVTTCKKLLTDLEEAVVINKTILEKSGHLLKSIIEKS